MCDTIDTTRVSSSPCSVGDYVTSAAALCVSSRLPVSSASRPTVYWHEALHLAPLGDRSVSSPTKHYVFNASAFKYKSKLKTFITIELERTPFHFILWHINLHTLVANTQLSLLAEQGFLLTLNYQIAAYFKTLVTGHWKKILTPFSGSLKTMKL